jgi:dihydrofolate synthase/folylpolyglutamate synthase
VVTSLQTNEADRVIEEARLSKGVRRIRVGSDVTSQGLGFDLEGQRLRVEGRLGSYELSIPLLGRHQLDNAAAAVAALEALMEKGYNISRESIISGLAQVKWPGRLQVLKRNPILVVDGAHNPGAVRVLKESLKQCFKFDRAILVIGISRDKDIASIVSELYSFFNKVIVTRSHHPRAGVPELIAAEFRHHGADVQTTESISEAISLATSLAGKKGLVCVAGSLFIVAEAIEYANKTMLPIEW